MKTKIISILALLLTVTQGAWAASPTGELRSLDSYNGSIYINGWAYDPDAVETSISVDYYIYTSSNNPGSSMVKSGRLQANGSNSHSWYSISGNHEFGGYIDVSNVTPGTYYICVFGLDTSGTGNTQIHGAGGASSTYEFTVTIKAPYSVTYNANGGSGAPSAQKKSHNIVLTLSSTEPTRDGYTFTGWNTAADGTGTNYAAGATYTGNADLSLYAQWTHRTMSGIDWDPSANSGTFLMPAYNVEVSTELWYKVDEEKTLDENIAAYGGKSDFFLNRTLKADVWNTFASPFAIAAGDMTKYFGAGAKVRQLESTSVAENVLTLNFTDATEIVAGQPYLVKPAANVDFSADGKEFAGVNLTAASATPTATTYVNFVPTLGKTEVTGDVKDILILNASGTLVHPSAVGNMKGFRGYFVMHAPAHAREFIMNFGNGETTGIIAIGTDRAASTDNATYTLDGRRIQSQPTQKGVYIQNGRKVVIK